MSERNLKEIQNKSKKEIWSFVGKSWSLARGGKECWRGFGEGLEDFRKKEIQIQKSERFLKRVSYTCMTGIRTKYTYRKLYAQNLQAKQCFEAIFLTKALRGQLYDHSHADQRAYNVV